MRDPLFCLAIIAVFLLGLVAIIPCFEKKGSGLVSLAAVSDQSTQLGGASNKIFVEPSNFQPESPELYLIKNNSLLGIAPPVTVNKQVLGAILGETLPETKKEIIEYSVESGDSLSAIAENFEISLNTLLWANNLSSGSTLKVGQKLIILPVSGVVYHVKTGDTISGIAQKYKADAGGIVSFNELSSEDDIFVGDILVVPDGVMPAVPKTIVYAQEVPVASSYFICPIASPCRITQGLHWYNAIDFSHGNCGDYIYAAAGGIVQRVKLGWNGGAGNTITILHPNGVVTSYGHILASLVNPGDQVSQGQIIALMGGQPGMTGAGKSTGCHVHFQVIGARNPFAR